MARVNALSGGDLTDGGALIYMSKLGLDSAKVRTGLKDMLFGPVGLYEALRERGGSQPR